jgi:hypothetical protein
MDKNNVNLSVILGLVERVIDDYKARGIHAVDLGAADAYVSIATEEMFDGASQADERRRSNANGC